MIKLHILILNEVQQRWWYFRTRSILQKLMELGEIKPKAIDIIQTENYDERTNLCKGRTLNKWRYDNKGLRLLSPEEYSDQLIAEHCTFCIDKEKKRLIIEWAKIFPSDSSRKKIHYVHSGVTYELFDNDGIADFNTIGCWMD